LSFRRLAFALPIVAMAGIGIGMPGHKPAGAGYITAPVERGDLRTTLSATGTLSALVTVKVGSQLSGQIAELLVDFNDEVRQGQPLARLDPRTFEAKVREAEAALEVARAKVLAERAALDIAAAELAVERSRLKMAAARGESASARLLESERSFRRSEILAKGATLAQTHVDQASTAYLSAAAELRATEAETKAVEEGVAAARARRAMAEAGLQFARAAEQQGTAALEQARIDLTRTVIRAPTDGVVIGRDVDRGQTVAASLEAPTLFTIAQNLQQMEVLANIDEADIGRVRVGQVAAFTVDAHPGRVFGAAVTQIRKAPQLVQNVVTYTVVLSTANADLALLPGMTAVARITVDEAEGVLKVPNAALRFQPPEPAAAQGAVAGEAGDAGTGALVWVPGEDGAPVPRRVALGRSDGSATELLGDALAPGQEVIVGTIPAPERRSFLGLRWGT
jgi:HlyD family secretion protein